MLVTREKALRRQLDEIAAWYGESNSIAQIRSRCHAALEEIATEFIFTHDDFDFDYLCGQRAALEHALTWNEREFADDKTLKC